VRALASLNRLVRSQAVASGVVVVLLVWLAYFGNADLLSLDAVVLAVPAAVLAAGLVVHLRALGRRSDEAWDWLRQFEWALLVFYVVAAVVVLAFGHAWWAAVVAVGMAGTALPAQSLLRSPELNAWLDGAPTG
jgi:hypothetical protein